MKNKTSEEILHLNKPMPNINSLEWWNNSFETQWEINKGSEQTPHQMELILTHLPSHEYSYLSTNPLRILNWDSCHSSCHHSMPLVTKMVPYP